MMYNIYAGLGVVSAVPIILVLWTVNLWKMLML